MTSTTPKELTFARKLLDEDKYQESLDVLNKFEKKKGITAEDLIECLLTKGKLHRILDRYVDAIKIAEQASIFKDIY